jgi:hypothetical protein
MSDEIMRMGEVAMVKYKGKKLLARPKIDRRLGLIFIFMLEKYEGGVGGNCVTDGARTDARSYMFLYCTHDWSLV